MASEKSTRMNCEALQASLETLGDWRWSPAAQQHLSECAACRILVHDLELLAHKLRQLNAPEPSPALWERIRFQLELEGIIHPLPQAEPVAAAPLPAPPKPRGNSSRTSRSRA